MRRSRGHSATEALRATPFHPWPLDRWRLRRRALRSQLSRRGRPSESLEPALCNAPVWEPQAAKAAPQSDTLARQVDGSLRRSRLEARKPGQRRHRPGRTDEYFQRGLINPWGSYKYPAEHSLPSTKQLQEFLGWQHDGKTGWLVAQGWLMGRARRLCSSCRGSCIVGKLDVETGPLGTILTERSTEGLRVVLR